MWDGGRLLLGTADRTPGCGYSGDAFQAGMRTGGFQLRLEAPVKDITIGRYDDPEKTGGWAGWVEPKDKSWILFIDKDNKTLFFPKRDETGGIVGEPATQAA